MPIFLNEKERRIWLESIDAPTPLLDMLSTVGFRAATSAIKLRLFDVLAESPLSAEVVAEKIGADKRGTKLLLRTLEAFGYVLQGNGDYINSPMVNKWMLTAEAGNIFNDSYRLWATNLFNLWGNLEGSLLEGKPTINFYDWLAQNPDVLKNFQTLLSQSAEVRAQYILAEVELPPTASRLLDLGGGHGCYSIALCREYPTLTATIFDLPDALEIGRDNITKAGKSDRITLEAGDFMVDDLGMEYDIVLLCNIIHCLVPEENIKLLNKVANALNPDGIIVISEPENDDTESSPPTIEDMFTRVYNLQFFHLFGSQIYTIEEVMSWFNRTGFVAVRYSPDHNITVARKQR